jgi:2-polyprenyl-3-methyl-5-hydroxy-6-metoxy-1,4-benzoquinol methylase
MTFLDTFLQNWRIRKAKRYLAPGARVLDIGSADGALFKKLSGQNLQGLGIDPTLKGNTSAAGIPLVAGFFPKDMPLAEPFDAITMLAVLEHFPLAQYEELKTGCFKYLKPGGKLIITVPSPFVDEILKVLTALRLVDGMSLEEHHGYDVGQTISIFPAPQFRLLRHTRFQLGLNNLFVFERQ